MAVSDLFSGLTVNLNGVVTGSASIDDTGTITINTELATNQFALQDISSNSAYASDSTTNHFDINKVQKGGAYFIDASQYTWDNLPTAVKNEKITVVVFGAVVGSMARYLYFLFSESSEKFFIRIVRNSIIGVWRQVTIT